MSTKAMTRRDWRIWAEQATEVNRKKAQAEFTEQAGKEIADNCDYLLFETRQRQRLIDIGEAPRPFGAFDRDMIARILTCETEIIYTYYVYVEDGDDDEVIDDPGNAPVGCSEGPNPAEEAKIRGEFIEAYVKYLYDCAVRAKNVGAESAMRMYLRAWKIVSGPGLLGAMGGDKRLRGSDAIKAVNLEAVADERLWVAVEAAKLPEYTVKKA